MMYKLLLTETKEYEIGLFENGILLEITEESSETPMNALKLFKDERVVFRRCVNWWRIAIMERLEVLVQVQELDDFLLVYPEHFL